MSTFNRYRSIYSHEELMERLRNLRHVALDMDGTIYMGMSLFPYTKPFLAGLREQGVNYSFLTNNPSKCIADYLHKLEVLGIEATEEDFEYEFSALAAQCGVAPEQVKSFFDEETLKAMGREIRQKKAVSVVLNAAVVETVEE